MFFKRRPKEATAPEKRTTAAGSGSKPGGEPQAVLRDELGLYQLWYLKLRLRDEVARAARAGSVFSVAAWQLRLLPGEVPDPQFLARCAALIVRSLRFYDVPARIDSERFAAVLLDADYRNAATVAFRIKGDLQLRVPTAGKWQAGVATFGGDGVDGDSLIHAALRRLEKDARAAA